MTYKAQTPEKAGNNTNYRRENSKKTQKGQEIIMGENGNLEEQMREGTQPETEEIEEQETEVTVEDLMSELAKEKAERAKEKLALDKALKEKGELTKKLRARMTAEEQEDEAKRQQQEEHNKYVKGLEDKIALIDAKNRYLSIGMTAELAEVTAKAELDGDKDTVAANYKKHMESAIKAAEAEWLKSRPEPNAGNGEEDTGKDPFLAGFNNK